MTYNFNVKDQWTCAFLGALMLRPSPKYKNTKAQLHPGSQEHISSQSFVESLVDLFYPNHSCGKSYILRSSCPLNIMAVYGARMQHNA